MHKLNFDKYLWELKRFKRSNSEISIVANIMIMWLQYEEFACANYEALTKILFVLYMFIMPIMMINILIAMMGNTYTTVIAQAEKAWRQQVSKRSLLMTCTFSRTLN